MYRAIHLASLAYNATYPNPRVGAVLVHKNRVIGEGFHHAYGEPHAEVMCLKSVTTEDVKYIPESSLYVTLEPCNHHGKTPPCTDLILQNQIAHVVVACLDPHPLVSGEGIAKLRDNGVHVDTEFLHEEAYEINKYFMHFWENQKPYVILKWAEDADGMIGIDGQRVQISSKETNDFTMRWRSEVDAIIIGKNTLITDDPLLTNRSNLGVQPKRIVLDSRLESLEYPNLHIIKERENAYFFNTIKNEKNLVQIKNNGTRMDISDVLSALRDMKVLVVIVEGGREILQSFIDANMYDEVRQIRCEKHINGNIPAPILPDTLEVMETITFGNDEINYYYSSF